MSILSISGGAYKGEGALSRHIRGCMPSSISTAKKAPYIEHIQHIRESIAYKGVCYKAPYIEHIEHIEHIEYIEYCGWHM